MPVITGPPTHSVRRRLSHVVVCIVTGRRNVTHQKTARGGPVVLRPVRATPCYFHRCKNANNSNSKILYFGGSVHGGAKSTESTPRSVFRITDRFTLMVSVR